jgi:hypothetical protein
MNVRNHNFEDDKFMKNLILALILTLALGSVFQTEAKTEKQIKVQVNSQKTVPGTKMTIKFVSLVEDSRCPEGVNCIQAGNAKIKVTVKVRGGESKTFELNTNLGPKGESFEGYAINLVTVTPAPKDNIRINRNGYTATFTVSRLTR